MSRPNPPRQPIRNITCVAMRGNAVLQLATRGNAPTVIDPSRAIEISDVALAALIDALCQAIAVASTSCAVVDHLLDGAGRAGVLHATIVVACRGAVVILHQSWVAYAVVGRRGAHTAAGFLHDDGEDEAVVDAGLLGYRLDAVVNGAYFGAAVVCLPELAAGLEHQVFVIVEPER